MGVDAEPNTLPPLAGVADPKTLPLADTPPNTLPLAVVATAPNGLPDDGAVAELPPNTPPLDTALVEEPKVLPLLDTALPKILPELVVVVEVAAVEAAPADDVPKILPLDVELPPNIPLEDCGVAAVLPNIEPLLLVEVVAPNKLEDCVLLTFKEPKRLLVEAGVVVVVIVVVVVVVVAPNSPCVAEVVVVAPNKLAPLVDKDLDVVVVLSPTVLFEVVVAPAPKMLPDEIFVF